MYRKNRSKLTAIVLTIAMILTLMPMPVSAISTGTSDGFYDFGGLNTTADSGGSGYNKLGDKFKVPNGMYTSSAALSASTGVQTAIYLNSANVTAKIGAEDNGTCGSFTFQDLKVSAFQDKNGFSAFKIVFKDNLGNEISSSDLGASAADAIPTSSAVTLSTIYPGHGEWNVAGVSQIEITFAMKINNIGYLSFEEIKLAGISPKHKSTAAPTIISQPSDVTANVNGTASLSVAAGSGSSLSYQWYSNDTNSNSGGSLISGATSVAYNAPTSSLGTKYYYCVVTNTDTTAINSTASITTNAAKVVINDVANAAAPTITLQPQDTTTTIGQSASVSVTATGTGNLSYQWYSNTTDSNLGGTLLSGAASATYMVVPASIGTKYYYCEVTNTDTSVAGNQTAMTKSSTAEVIATPIEGLYDFSELNTTENSGGSGYNKLGDLFKVPNSMFSAGGTLGSTSAALTAVYLSGNSTATAVIKAAENVTCGSFTFQDLGMSAYLSAKTFTSCNITLKDNLGNLISNEILTSPAIAISSSEIVNLSTVFPSHGEWNVAGVSSIELTYTLSAAGTNMIQFENIKLASVNPKHKSTVVPTIISQPSGVTANVNSTAELSVTAGSGASLSYQWYSSDTNSNSGGTLISGATSAAYNAPTSSLGTKYYYCIVTNTDTNAINSTASITTNAAKVVINDVANAVEPSITAQPQDTTTKTGQSASVSVTATGTGTLSYQWYSNTTDLNLGGTLLSGATGATYMVVPASIGTKYYYCEVTNTDTSVTGNQTAMTKSSAAEVIATPGDGLYDFSGLNTTANSGGSGYNKLGDLFKVSNSMFGASGTLGSTSTAITAVYLSNPSTATAVINAEGNGTCGSFTFKDLGMSSYQIARTFTSFKITFKDNLGNEISSDDFGTSAAIAVSPSQIINISTIFPSHGEWDTAGVTSIELTYTLSAGGTNMVQFENIKIADVSSVVNKDVTSITVTGEGDQSAITTHSGTLQMSAAVLPADATNPSVVWSVKEIDGTTTTKAAISSTGLLTAASNGTVRVTATSVSNGTISGTKDITITNNPLAPTTYTATINTNVDEAAAAALGAVELKQSGVTKYTATNSATGTYTASVVDGTYDIFINSVDTGKDITISGAAASAAVNYFTVSFAVSNAGNASGSTILATASGAGITSGTVVLSGSAIEIAAAPAGASTYTYLWSGAGTSGETTASLNIASLSSSLNATCTVTGTPAPIAPSVTTQAMSSILSTTATGNGTLVSLGVPNPTAYGVCWNTTGTPTTSDSRTNNGAAAATGAFTASMTGLMPNTTYYVRSYATNTTSTAYGGEVTFTTNALAPTATTSFANGITATSATLNGTVNANNASTVVTFEYGLTLGYGSNVTASQSPVSGSSATSVSCVVSGLTSDTTYHYRVVGVNVGGISNGSDQTFTTSSVAPLTYTIAPISNQTMTGLTAGYGSNTQETKTVMITNNGTGKLTSLACSITGTDFDISQPISTELLSGASTSFIIKAKDALTAGVYTAAITLSATNMTNQTFNVTQIVSAPGTNTYTISADTTPFNFGSLTAGYGSAPASRTVTITNTGNQTITLTEPATTNASSNYTIGSLSDADLTAGEKATFTLQPKLGLVAGTYNETIQIAGTDSAATSISMQFSVASAGSGSGSGSGGGNNNSGPSAEPAGKDATIKVNGQSEPAGTATTSMDGDRTVTTITVDDQKIQERISAESNGAIVSIPIGGASDIGEGVLNGQTIKNMEEKEAVLEIKTDSTTYSLPASEIDIDSVSSKLGQSVELKDIKISVKIAEPSEDTVQMVRDTADKNKYQIIVKPVEFEITCTSGSKTVSVSKFNGYVERTIAIPDGIDPSKITTGIVLNADGTFSHVPTMIVEIDGKYYAKINSLTNSTYSVIYNPTEFADVTAHWAKDAINEMASRLVISGVGENNYEPNREITRAEFAAIMVRALGLTPDTSKNTFDDVAAAKWYSGYVGTAASYGIISGYDADTFAPNAKITREQAMAMVARAMKITDLIATTASTNIDSQLSGYTDADKISGYAEAGIKACLDTGIITGKTAATIAPKANITRAEVAVIIERLLEKSELI